mgnify:CR=1 FL=1
MTQKAGGADDEAGNENGKADHDEDGDVFNHGSEPHKQNLK